MPKKPSAATEAQLDAQLAVAVKRAASLVTTGGARRLTPQDPLRVFYVTHTTSNNASAGPSAAGSPSPDMVSFPLTSSSASTSSVQQLVDAAAPSPFGKRKRTVHDPAVRTAMEIKAAQLALNKTLPPQEVLEEVRALLQPSASSVVAELDKLNIYGPGGFFKPHYDTPRSQDHFGTLIVCLPSPFKGGQLVLRHTDHSSSDSGSSATKTYDWSTSNSTRTMPQDLQWAAFYADTEHEVLPVTEGHRITLTYNLRAVHQQPFPTPIAAAGVSGRGARQGAAAAGSGGAPDGSWMTAGDVSASAELTAEIKRLMADKKWHNKGERLGFVLQQKYTAGLADLSSLPFPDSLKGPDRVLAAALSQAGLKPRVKALFRGWTGDEFYEQGGNDDYLDDDEYERPSRPMNFGRPLQPAQCQAALTNEPDAYWALLVAKFGRCARSLNEGYVEDHYCFFQENTESAVAEVFGAKEQDTCWVTPVVDRHFTYHASVLAGANTACEMYFYATAALLVDVPSWADRQDLI